MALRCMEARELIDEVIQEKEVYGRKSLEHYRLSKSNPELCTGEDDGLFAVLDKVFTKQAENLPLLFDPKSAGIALKPSASALKRCISLLSGNGSLKGQEPAAVDVFKAPDALGWAYQYWNSEEKDRVFENVRTKKGAKIEGADLVPATQLYTEPYMVKFLVQNSLGATWMGIHPTSKLYEKWEYFVRDADRVPVEKKSVSEITFLDPACGSGHFLIEAFDLFYDMYEEEGILTEAEEICRSIIQNNLFGIDIDERAVQIAEASLWMKAAEKAFDFKGVPSNLVATNIRLPKGKDHLKEFLSKYPDDEILRPTLEVIFESLGHADELGSLLQIEEPVEKELKYIKERYTLEYKDTDWKEWKESIVKRLREHFAGEAEEADVGQVFFSRCANKGIVIFDLLARRYDVVAANPPYVGSINMGDNIRLYCQENYSKSKYDLFSVFIERCISLLLNKGISAIVTQETWLTSQQFTELRTEILTKYSFKLLGHIGPHGFSEILGGKVSTALILINKTLPSTTEILYSYKLNDIDYYQKEIYLKECINGKLPSRVFSLVIKKCLSIPKHPIAYWASDKLLNLLNSNISLGDMIENANFTKTGNNDRFLRYYWEISQESFNVGERWIWITKGTSFSRWYGSCDTVVDWSEGAQFHYKKDKVSRITKEEYIGISGLTYCTNSTLGLPFRFINRPGVSTYNSPQIFSKKLSNIFLLALLNSRYATYVTRLLSGPLAVVIGDIQRIPCPYSLIDCKDFLEKLAQLSLECKKNLISIKLDESDYNLNNISVLYPNLRTMLKEIQNFSNIFSVFLALATSEIDNYIINKLDINEERKNICELLGTPVGWFNIIVNYDYMPKLSSNFIDIPKELINNLGIYKKLILNLEELNRIKMRLKGLYEINIQPYKDKENFEMIDENSEEIISGQKHIPAETFLEELSQKMEIHPISIYWLLKEGIEQEGWRCIPEEKRFTEDRFTVIILRLLGHRWPKQIEAGEAVPEWADKDGIIPLTEGTDETTLLQRVRERISVEFEGGDVTSIEREFSEIMGITLEKWLEGEFFKHHIKQFKKRPVAWQIQSGRFTNKRKPAFSCLVYYHKLDGDLIPKIRSQYIGPLRQRYETELRSIESISPDSRSDRQEVRRVELGGLIQELKDFDMTLKKVITEGFDSKILTDIIKKETSDKWCSIDGIKPFPDSQDALLRQEMAYIPDINDGVRVNIAPLQKAGLLSSEVLAKKDLDKAISDRALWRADERRWCREGKLPVPGWWKIQ